MKIKTSLLIPLFLLLGCSQNSTVVSASKTHVEKSQELQMIMHKFDNLIYEHFQSELDRDEKRLEYTESMIPLIDELVENSRRLQQIQNNDLKKSKKKDFHILAKQLEMQSIRLKKMLIEYKPEEIALNLYKIKNICTQCHNEIH